MKARPAAIWIALLTGCYPPCGEPVVGGRVTVRLSSIAHDGEGPGQACRWVEEMELEARYWKLYTCDGVQEAPGHGCNLGGITMTRLSDGTCVRTVNMCPGVLDDPAFGHCSESAFPDCCDYDTVESMAACSTPP